MAGPSLPSRRRKRHDVKILTRVVDYGGLFHDDVKPGHQFGQHDHRTFRPAGWVEAGNEKMDRMRAIAGAAWPDHAATGLHLESPAGSGRKCRPDPDSGIRAKREAIETKVEELASLPEVTLSADECAQIAEIGDNTNCMSLKGGSAEHTRRPFA